MASLDWEGEALSTQLHLSLWPRLSFGAWDLYYMLSVCCAVTCSDAFLKQSKFGDGWSLLCLMNFLTGTQVKQRACMLSCVRLFATPWSVAHQSPVYGVFQARILESVAISYSRGASLLRDWTLVSLVPCIGRQILYNWHHLGSPKSNKVSV